MSRLDELDFAERAPAERPYLVINMVASVDGRATIHGRTKDLSSPADKAVFFGLRRAVDAVLVGTGTLREERYGPILPDADEQPLAIVCSRRGEFPTDIGLFTDPRSRVLTHTGPSPAEALRRARDEHGVRSVLCEGGPTLNAELLRAGGVDELFHCLAPKIAGEPGAPTMVTGVLHETAEMELVSLLESESHLFMRYRLR